MCLNSKKHHRRSIRLKGYDYSQAGGYFVTLCTQDRESLFGEIADGEMHLNDAGKMIEMAWNDLPERFNTMQLAEHIVMPNHFHGIVIIAGAPLVGAPPVNATNISINIEGAGTRPAPTLGDIIGAFKSITTHEYIMASNKIVGRHSWAGYGNGIIMNTSSAMRTN